MPAAEWLYLPGDDQDEIQERYLKRLRKNNGDTIDAAKTSNTASVLYHWRQCSEFCREEQLVLDDVEVQRAIDLVDAEPGPVNAKQTPWAAEAAELYAQGWSAAEIAREFGVSKQRAHLVVAGKGGRRQRYAEPWVDDAVRLHTEGAGLKEISAEVGKSISHIHAALASRGMRRSQRAAWRIKMERERER